MLGITSVHYEVGREESHLPTLSNNKTKRGIYIAQALQVTFHGISRSEAVEQAVQKELNDLSKFDRNLGPCHATITQEGHQTMGAYTVRVTIVASGSDLVVSRTNNDVMLAIREAFDTLRRSVKDAAEKLRGH